MNADLCIILFVVFTSQLSAHCPVVLSRSIQPTAKKPNGEFQLLLLHTNDMHSRFDENNQYGSSCSDELKRNGKCYGGFARLKQAVREARKDAENRGISSVFLNAGDTFQGTVYYSLLKWKVVADLIGTLDIDVMSLGNHEFDDGVNSLKSYLENITIPTVAANLDLTNAPDLQLPILTKSKVLHIGGKKIGIVGYVTPETMTIADTGNVIVEEEIPYIRKEARTLKKEGVDIVIALGHSGYETDCKIARQVSEVSVVVGGHTNTFLYNPEDSPPDIEKPASVYPHMETQSSGRKVPVVQAYAYTKYLGKLWLTFDDKGDVVEATGNPLLLNSSIKQDPEVLRRLAKWSAKIDVEDKLKLGRTRVFLEGSSESCGLRECNLGNFVTDAFVDAVADKSKINNDSWIDAPIALAQQGSIRSNININTITSADVLVISPFQNDLRMLRLTGETIRKALEHSVRRYANPPLGGEFLQMSGLRVEYDLSKKSYERVLSVYVRCGKCTVPHYTPMLDDAIYTVLISRYLELAGNGFTMFRDESLASVSVGITDTMAISNYIKKLQVIYPGNENRIVLMNQPQVSQNNAYRLLTNFLFSSSLSVLPLLVSNFIWNK